MGIREIRRDNLNQLLTGYESQKDFAEAVGLSPGHVSQMVNGTRDMGEQVARRIEKRSRLVDGWMDSPHTKTQDDQEADLLTMFRKSDARGKAFILNIAENEAKNAKS